MNKRFLIILIVAATIPRLLFFILNLNMGEAAFLKEGDSQGYIQIAKNLTIFGVFSFDNSSPPMPDNVRVPIYPFFLALFSYFSAPLWVIVLIQNFISLGTVLLVYLWGRSLFEERIAQLGSFLFAIEPQGALFSNLLMSEFVFTPLLIVFLFSMISYIRQGRQKFIIMGSIFIGLASLTHPIAFPLFLFIPLAALLKHHFSKTFLRQGLLGLLFFLLIVSPWFIRNKIVLNSFSVSSVIDYNLVFFNVPLFQQWLNISIEDKYIFPLDYGNLKFNEVKGLSQDAKKFILEHPLKYFQFHLISSPSLYTDDGYADILRYYYRVNTGLTISTRDFIGSLDYGEPLLVLKKFVVNPIYPLYSLVYVFGKTSWLLVGFGVISMLFLVFRIRDAEKKKVYFYCLILLATYALLASPLGGARHRIPLNFIIFILFSTSFYFLYDFIKNKSLWPKL